MRLEFKLILVLTFFGIICTVLSKTGEVIFVNIIARHGARNPTWFYDNDKHKNDPAWKEGKGMLRKEGREQTHNLGVWLHSRYSHLLSDSSKIYVQTTDVDRVKDSAKCLLSGMFPSHGGSAHGGSAHGGHDVDCKTNIPLHTTPSKEDYILASRAPCKAYDEELEKVYKSKEIEEKNKKFAKVYHTINTKSGSKGIKGDRVEFIHKIYDTILVEKEAHLTPDQWAVAMLGEMEQAGILFFTIPTWNEKLKKLRSGPLIEKMIKDMNDKKNNKTKHDVMLYMAHDNTITSFLNTLGKWDKKKLPDYASFVLLELVEEGKGKYDVKLYYSQSTKPQPKLLESASLTKFEADAKKVIPANWKAECNK